MIDGFLKERDGEYIYCRTSSSYDYPFYDNNTYYCKCGFLAGNFYLNTDSIIKIRCYTCIKDEKCLTKEELRLITKHNIRIEFMTDLKNCINKYIKQYGEEEYKKDSDRIVNEYYIKEIIE